MKDDLCYHVTHQTLKKGELINRLGTPSSPQGHGRSERSTVLWSKKSSIVRISWRGKRILVIWSKYFIVEEDSFCHTKHCTSLIGVFRYVDYSPSTFLLSDHFLPIVINSRYHTVVNTIREVFLVKCIKWVTYGTPSMTIKCLFYGLLVSHVVEGVLYVCHDLGFDKSEVVWRNRWMSSTTIREQCLID